MHVGLVSGSYPPMHCGVGDYTAQLARALAEAGQEVTVVTSAAARQEAHASVRVCPEVADWGWAALPRLLATLREAGVEVANIQYPTQQYGRRLMVNALPGLIQARLGVPAVATVHEFSSFTAAGRARLALTARLSRAVISTDSANHTLLARWAGGPPRHALIPLAPNLPCAPPAGYDRSALRTHLGAGPASVVLAYFGFVSPSKGLEHLLEAFAAALAEAPGLDLRLWLLAGREAAAARYAAYHASIARQLEQLAGRERVAWTGYLEPAEVSAHLLAADVAVLPFHDGASLRRTTLLAALTHGLPVVSTLGPGTATDGLGEAQGVYLVPAGRSEPLAQAILHLARDEGLRRALGASAQAFAAGFSWPAVATQTLAVYKRALGGGDVG